MTIPTQSLIKEVGKSLIVDNSDRNRKKWAKYIIANNYELKGFFEILHGDKTAATHFMWMVGDLCEIKPEMVSPAIESFFMHRIDSRIKNYDRSLAKMFWLCGIPEKIEGEATTLMFDWILDPEVIVSTKNYSLLALCNLTAKYDELKNELKLVIEDQFDKNTVSFKKCAEKVLRKINTNKIEL